jgi:Family of unknown function (DUF5808)
MKRKKRSNFGSTLWRAVVIVLVGLAVRDQLRLPPEERTWHGRIGGVIPYDFRRPTLERIRAAFWNKETSQILVPQPFGVGWTVNLYPLLHPGTAGNQQ